MRTNYTLKQIRWCKTFSFFEICQTYWNSNGTAIEKSLICSSFFSLIIFERIANKNQIENKKQKNLKIHQIDTQKKKIKNYSTRTKNFDSYR